MIHHPLPAAGRAAGVPQVVTVHDLAFERLPELFDARYRAVARRAHRAAARRADAVVCVSETTARDVRALWAVPAERIVLARHGPGQEPADQPRRPEPEHFLYVGDAEPRKNLAALLAAYRAYREAVADPLPLVLAGARRGARSRDQGRDPPRGAAARRALRRRGRARAPQPATRASGSRRSRR